jgi:hypothetical protein
MEVETEVIKDGMVVTLVLELLMGIALVVLVGRAKAGKKIPVIHKIAGLAAIDEAIGRATELGTPIMFVPGKGDLADAQTYAALPVLEYAAKQCAEYDTRIVVPLGVPVVYTVAEAVTRQAYLSKGKGDKYRETDVRFINEQNWAWAAGITGIMEREKVSAQILFGAFWAEALFLAEAGNRSGAMQIAGTASTNQIPFFVAACDYTLIGQEIFAASAYLNPEPSTTGGLIVQDWGKMLGMVVVLAGAILATFGNQALIDLMTK